MSPLWSLAQIGFHFVSELSFEIDFCMCAVFLTAILLCEWYDVRMSLGNGVEKVHWVSNWYRLCSGLG